MTEDLTPSEIRARRFEPAMRGYQRDQVDAFREEMAATVESLHDRIADLEARFEQVGLSEPKDLEAEFEAVASEVGAVLQAARQAAAEMRSRAAADAARWRAEADEESRRMRTEAAADAEAARRAGWETGTEMLRQAEEQAAQIVAAAEQDALFIRAEAEREALRLTGDARRDREEELRAARTQAERMLMDARAESEAILETARQSAESAQERARALEQRRAELMEELEAARQSIGQLEAEIDTRREALSGHGLTEPAGLRVITGAESEAAAEGEWLDDDMSVRLVPVERVPPTVPVDADDLVAEVAEMRRRSEEPDEPFVEAELASTGTAPAELHTAIEEEHAPETPSPEPEIAEAEPEVTTVEPEQEVAEAEPVVPAPEPPIEAAELSEEPETLVTERDEEGQPDDLADLFAKLRTEPVAPVPAPPPQPAEAAVEETPAVDTAETDAAEPEATPAPSPSRMGTPETADDPFDVRDRLLLPVENRALRAVKRRLVDLQNRVLEELRVSGTDWTVDEAMFSAAFGDDLRRLAHESLVAGYAGAAELTGSQTTPQPPGEVTRDMTGPFVSGLRDAVADAVRSSKAADAGTRQLSAAVSRVFRAWRTDEAERRLRAACTAAYHEGLLRALPLLGVDEVMGVAPGKPCGSCPAGTDLTWAPAGPPPNGTDLPPASESCRCTVVPAA